MFRKSRLYPEIEEATRRRLPRTSRICDVGLAAVLALTACPPASLWAAEAAPIPQPAADDNTPASESAAKLMRVSSIVLANNLISKKPPQYPAAARTLRLQGTVVLKFTLSKAGSVTNLVFVSGPPIFRQAALDAVNTWRYKPYMVDGKAAEVETEISIDFVDKN